MDDGHDAIWIEAADAGSAALLMREGVGRIPARLVQCAGSRWRVVVHATGSQRPTAGEVIALVRCWLARTGLCAAEVHLGARAFTVRRAPAALATTSRDPCRRDTPPRIAFSP